MVHIDDGDEYDVLDRLVREAVQRFGLRLDVSGWTRKTYDVFDSPPPGRSPKRLARIESFATTNGEVVLFDEVGLEFAKAMATALEGAFGIADAVIRREPG